MIKLAWVNQVPDEMSEHGLEENRAVAVKNLSKKLLNKYENFTAHAKALQ